MMKGAWCFGFYAEQVRSTLRFIHYKYLTTESVMIQSQVVSKFFLYIFCLLSWWKKSVVVLRRIGRCTSITSRLHLYSLQIPYYKELNGSISGYAKKNYLWFTDIWWWRFVARIITAKICYLFTTNVLLQGNEWFNFRFCQKIFL